MQVLIIILLILAILLVIFTLQNAMDISINVFFWEIKDAPLVIVLLACILIGYLVATLYLYPKLWKTRREYNQLIKFNSELKELHEMNQKEQKAESDISTDPEGIELDDEDDGSIFFRD